MKRVFFNFFALPFILLVIPGVFQPHLPLQTWTVIIAIGIVIELFFAFQIFRYFLRLK